MTASRLLVLDDDLMVGKTIGFIAEAIGFEVRLETEGDAFLAAIDSWRPSHIVLDLVMPGLDGVQVIERLAGRGCRAQLVIVSGLDGRVLEAASRNARELGLTIAGVLRKPFLADGLRTLLRAPCAAAMPAAWADAESEAARCTPLHAPDGGDDADLVEDLADAIAEGDLAVAYQPKVTCDGARLAGFEVLVRWQHPLRGDVGPAQFVPLAERVGLVDALTMCVLDQALPWFARTCASVDGRADLLVAEGLHLSVNLSARTLADSGFVEEVAQRCVRHGVPPGRLMFELTETAAMGDPVGSLALLTRLRMKGFPLSIDDFGTGFSSMLQLVRLPFSEIKVDRSFVASVPKSKESQAVVRSIIDLGHSLGLTVAAEGVEDAATMDFLLEAGCDLAQGYLVARPLGPTLVQPWLDARWPPADGAASAGSADAGDRPGNGTDGWPVATAAAAGELRASSRADSGFASAGASAAAALQAAPRAAPAAPSPGPEQPAGQAPQAASGSGARPMSAVA
jgi:EAL domain-containing protein (putative c-di-GMP-specific phosphodiesterase class I)